MSPLRLQPWTHSSAGRSEAATLRRGVAWSSTVLAVLAVGAIVIAFFVSPDEPTPSTRAVVLAAMASAVTGVVLRDRRVGPWLSVAAIIMLLVVGMELPQPPVDLLIMGTYCVMVLAILLSSRDWGIGWIVLGVIMLIVVESHSTTRVAINDQFISVGFVAVIQGIVAGGWLWWAWHTALSEAERRDVVAAGQEQAIATSLSVQERTRAWRAAIMRAHETILNDLRYVLRSPEVDRARLREQLLSTRDARRRPPRPAHTLSSAIDRAALQFTGEVNVVGIEDLGGVVLPEEVDGVLVEVVRNVARHADATRILIAVGSDPEGLTIEIVDNGLASDTVPGGVALAPPGIGKSVVLGEASAAAGARVVASPHRTIITVSTGRTGNPPAGSTLPWLLSVVLVGSALGGSLQYLFLLAEGPPAYAVVTLAAYGLTALATVVVVRRRPIGWLASVTGSLLAVMVALGLAFSATACTPHPLALTTLNLSVDALFGMLLWSRSRAMWLVTLPVFGTVLTAIIVPEICSAPVGDVLLSSVVLMPILVIVSWGSARRAERWGAEDRRRWETDITQGALTEAETDLAHHLEGTIEHAWSLMWELAGGAELDEARRRRLRSLESAIRAAIQTDPRTSGGFARAAQQIVSAAVADDVPVHVRALRGSADPRPVHPRVVEALTSVAGADAQEPASIHVFCDGFDDYLALTTTASVATSRGFPPGSVQTYGEAILEVEFTESDGGIDPEVTLLLRRAVTAPDAPRVTDREPSDLVADPA